MKAILFLSIFLAFAFAELNTTSCGAAFPRGCPTGASCIQANTFSKTCVCNVQGASIDFLTNTCVSPCPAFSVRDLNGTCRCVAPYVASIEGRCVLGQQATCQNINCSLGFHCVYNFTVPTCVRDQNAAVCGNDFRCPDRYVCVDSTFGPFCRCAEGFAGPLCQYRRCASINNILGCPGYPNGTICTASSTSDAFCLCVNGRTPPDCTTVDACSLRNCTQENSICVSGRCVCQEGYVAVLTDRTFSCQPAANCSNFQCTGNTQCVVRNNVPQCVCPADRFGASDCSRPSCSTDADCGLANAYCVNNTRNGVASFCVCKPGWTGDNCTKQVQQCACNSNATVCNNENRCVCAPGFGGHNCSINTPKSCITIRVYVRAEASLDAESLKAYLAPFIRVDQSVVNVTGPLTLNSSYVIFIVRICRDNNTDEQTASDDFVNEVNNGGGSEQGLSSAVVTDETGASTSSDQTTEGTVNGAASIAFTAVVTLLCVAFTLE